MKLHSKLVRAFLVLSILSNLFLGYRCWQLNATINSLANQTLYFLYRHMDELSHMLNRVQYVSADTLEPIYDKIEDIGDTAERGDFATLKLRSMGFGHDLRLGLSMALTQAERLEHLGIVAHLGRVTATIAEDFRAALISATVKIRSTDYHRRRLTDKEYLELIKLVVRRLEEAGLGAYFDFPKEWTTGG